MDLFRIDIHRCTRLSGVWMSRWCHAKAPNHTHVDLSESKISAREGWDDDFKIVALPLQPRMG